MIDPRQFRNALGRFATGVTVVTMRADAPVDTNGAESAPEAHGITVNAFMSVSLVPPLVAVCIDKRANAHATLLERERYGVSILRHDQESLSNHFAGRPTPGLQVAFEPLQGFPLLAGAVAGLVCRVTAAHDAGDHTLFVGEVEAIRVGEGAPLLYLQGKYAHVTTFELSE